MTRLRLAALDYGGQAEKTVRLECNRITQGALCGDACVEVRVDVRNVGDRDGDEVVQLYVSDVEASVPVPRHHLEGFARVHLKAGETKTVSFMLKPEQFMCYADDGTPFLEPGDFCISVGGGQPDDPASGAVSTVLTVE